MFPQKERDCVELELGYVLRREMGLLEVRLRAEILCKSQMHSSEAVS